MSRPNFLIGWGEIEGYVGTPAEVIERWLEWGFPLREINGVPILAPDLVTEWIWILDRAQRELGLRHDLYDDREPEINLVCTESTEGLGSE